MANILITGANRGIGLALTKAYSAGGDTVMATARDPGAATELAETGAEVFPLDVTDGASVAALAAKLDDRPIDLLINNAGVGDRQDFGSLDYDTFEHVLAVNTLGPLRVMEALRGNVAVGTGKMIANISSQLGSIENAAGGGELIYRTSKAALNMALRAAAPRLAEDGITLLTLHPGWVSTDMGGPSAPVTPDDSAAGLKRVIAEAGASKELRFLDWRGETLPW